MHKYRTPPFSLPPRYFARVSGVEYRQRGMGMLSRELSALNPILLAGIVLLGLVVWGLVMFLLGRVSGWARLAEDYRSDSEMPSKRFRMRSVMIRWAHYGNCVTFGVDYRGLHMATFGPLLGHPRLLIPWPDISVTPKKVWWTACAELRFRRAPEIPVLISARLADQLTSAAGASSPAKLQHASVAARASS